jgi:hypothetical protein
MYKSILVLLLISTSAFSQIMPLTTEPSGGNKKATVSEQIGVVKIEITYNRPRVKGREGKIWNTDVAHYGFVDQGHGTSYAAPWRAGANENTTMSFSHPVKIDGQNLAAGKYGFFIALGETESTVIFSKVNNSWGSFYYDETQDALRVTVKNETLDKSVEWLKYEFTDQTDSTSVIAMTWEKRKIPFRVSVDRKRLQFEAFKNDFRTTRPTNDFITAARWCLNNNYELEQALAWIDRGIYFRVMGEKKFNSLNTKADILTKMKRLDEAKKIMDEAFPLGSVASIFTYGKKLASNNQTKDALAVFKINYDKYPEEFLAQVGMAFGYSALGEYKKALTYMKTALVKAPDQHDKEAAQEMITKLEKGEDINK